MKIKIQKRLSIVMCVLALALLCPSVYGQEEPSGSDEWNFMLTPYVWLLGQDGKLTIKGGTSDVDTGIIDNIESFRGGFQFYFEARKIRLTKKTLTKERGISSETKI